uniref:Uncharacterized protein n=1 Tax=Anopheles coluzzii TaxID=1518534 RepID=A0A8W7P8J5_ANOCL
MLLSIDVLTPPLGLLIGDRLVAWASLRPFTSNKLFDISASFISYVRDSDVFVHLEQFYVADIVALLVPGIVNSLRGVGEVFVIEFGVLHNRAHIVYGACVAEKEVDMANVSEMI